MSCDEANELLGNVFRVYFKKCCFAILLTNLNVVMLPAHK